MEVRKECVSGFGNTTSLWFHLVSCQLNAYTIETPQGFETVPANEWFDQHLLILQRTRQDVQKSTNHFLYLTFSVGQRAVDAVRDCSIFGLALAFTSHHAWQLVNGAKILPFYGELAKIYAGFNAVYLFQSEMEKNNALKHMKVPLEVA
jgi:hypothetical protein